MALAILNPEGFKDLSQYSGNPFLDAMTDLQGVVNTVITYQQHKPYIDKYSDTSLSDLKDKIKANLPEALNQDGSINFSKLEELASNGNPFAEHVLTIKQHRENFANAPIGTKIEAIKNETLSDILSGNKLTKEANVLKKMQQFDEFLKNNKNIPEWMRTLLSLNKEAFLGDPKLLAYVATIFSNQQPTQDNTQQDNNQQSDNIFSPPPIQSMQSIFNDKANSILQSLNPSTKPSQTSPSEKRKQAINKMKQLVETKKKQKTNKNNQPTIEQYINSPFYPLGYIPTQSQQQAQTQPSNDNSILNLFIKSITQPSSRVSFYPIDLINNGK